MSNAITQGIRVRVRSRYIAAQSDPRQGRYLFGYDIHIANEGSEDAKLLARHWVITDGMGLEQHVQGDGVVGRQPYLRPGESTEYSSFCPLPTPHGQMHGTYRMVRPDGSQFDAQIAPFALIVPDTLN